MKKYGISLLSIIPMRKAPEEQSEMISQILFGESFRVVGEHKTFYEVITQYDNYNGWIDHGLFYEITEKYYEKLNEGILNVQKSLLMSLRDDDSLSRLTIAGSSLPGFDPVKKTIEIEERIFHIQWMFGDFNVQGFDTIGDTAAQFLNAPYLWGGRSVLGCDCSGFVQVVYKIHGIRLNRDSYQQAEQGEPVSSLNEARLGDLAFFADTGHKIKHVGMVLSPDEIIHNSGYVHKDKLDETGIFNLQTQNHTHRLYSIRRITS